MQAQLLMAYLVYSQEKNNIRNTISYDKGNLYKMEVIIHTHIIYDMYTS